MALRFRSAGVGADDLEEMTKDNPNAVTIEALIGLATKEGVRVELANKLKMGGKLIDGVFNRATRTIKIQRGVSATTMLYVLVHELAHALTDNNSQMKQGVRSGSSNSARLQSGGSAFSAKSELIADSAAMRVFRELQVDDGSLYVAAQQVYYGNLKRLMQFHLDGESTGENLLADTTVITEEADRIEERILATINESAGPAAFA